MAAFASPIHKAGSLKIGYQLLGFLAARLRVTRQFV
jgi:hypothetical protein